MEKFIPILTDINQIFSNETLIKLQLRGFSNSLAFNWGPDRIVSLSNRDTTVKTQWNGTCSTFSVIAAIENKLGGVINLSERSLWDFYGVYSLEEAINSANIHFILEEKYWPQYQQNLDSRSKGKGRYKLLLIDYLESNYLKVLNAIDNGNPCVVALSTPKDLYNGMAQVEASSSMLRKSGHAICVSGYKVENGKGYFLVKNSWGETIGSNGYQYISFELFDNKGYAIFWEIKEIMDRGEQNSFDIIEQNLLVSES